LSIIFQAVFQFIFAILFLLIPDSVDLSKENLLAAQKDKAIKIETNPDDNMVMVNYRIMQA